MVTTRSETRATTTQTRSKTASKSPPRKTITAAKSTTKTPSNKKKVLVPRKKLQSVPDLLANGDEDVDSSESIKSKIIWMIFLCIMFYLSFEMFLRFNTNDNDNSNDVISDMNVDDSSSGGDNVGGGGDGTEL